MTYWHWNNATFTYVEWLTYQGMDILKSSRIKALTFKMQCHKIFLTFYVMFTKKVALVLCVVDVILILVFQISCEHAICSLIKGIDFWYFAVYQISCELALCTLIKGTHSRNFRSLQMSLSFFRLCYMFFFQIS